MSKQSGKRNSGGAVIRGRRAPRVKVWAIFVFAIAAELFLLSFYDSYKNGKIETVVWIYESMKTLCYVLPCALAVCAVLWFVLSRMKNSAAQVFAWFSVLFAFLSAWALLTEFYKFKGIKFLALIVGAAAVLLLVYYVYQREFFLSSLIVAGGIGALMIYRRSAAWGFLSARVYAVYILAALLLLLCVLLTLRLRKTRGLLSLGGKERRVFPSSADYRVVFLSCAVVAAALLASLFLGNLVAYFAMFVLGAYFFLTAVYSTVKLM